MVVDRINSALRRLPTWPIYIVGAAGGPWLFYLALTGSLGPEPIKALEQELGLLALQFLMASLAVTPLRRLIGVNALKFRRALGLLSFYYVTVHLAVWLLIDVQVPALIWEDIVKRPYITVGMAGFVVLVPLALTSNRWSIRRLGPLWNRLHKAAYAAVVLGPLHFFMLRKGIQIEPLLYMGGAGLLIGLRWPTLARPRNRLRESA